MIFSGVIGADVEFTVTAFANGLSIELVKGEQKIPLYVDYWDEKIKILEDNVQGDEPKRVIPIEWQKMLP